MSVAEANAGSHAGKNGTMVKEEKSATIEQEGAAQPKTPKQPGRIMSKLPDWLQRGLVDSRTWKNFIRAWIVFFCCMIILVDQKSLNAIGSAAFFMFIVAIILPPTLPATIFVFASLIMGMGMMFGWAWGCAAMAAAVRARSQTLLKSQYENVESGFSPDANVDAQLQVAVFEAKFLDPASSAVYGIFLFFGAYGLGLVRALRPKLMLGAIFATIIMDIQLSIGPLIPNTNYLLARQLLVPASAFVAIALVATFLLFPQTVNHLFLSSMNGGILRTALGIASLQEEIISTTDPARWAELLLKSRELRSKNAAAMNGLEGQVGMLQLEISRGRLGPKDVADVFEVAKRLSVKLYNVSTFVSILDRQAQLSQHFKDNEDIGGKPRMKRLYDDMEESRLESARFDLLMPILQSSTAPLLAASKASLADCIDWLDQINHHRWKKLPADARTIEQRQASLDALHASLEAFKVRGQFEMIVPFEGSFDPATKQLRTEHGLPYVSSARDLFRCYVFTTGLVDYCATLVELQQLLLEKERATPNARLQFPTAFAKMLFKEANDGRGPSNPLGIGVPAQSADEDVDDNSSQDTLVDDRAPSKVKREKSKGHGRYGKDPDAREPRNGVQKFGRMLHLLWRGLTSNAGIFALKYGLVSIALWVPAIATQASGKFYYANRGLWALIMAQTGMGLYAGEQVWAFLTRVAGTCAGLVLGMLAWYIGAAKGSGSPYGVVAATTIIVAPLLFVRIVAPMPLMGLTMMTPVTLVFVVGYSWVDGHTYQTANQGAGAGLAGRRALLVLIGFTGSMIMMLLPKPISAKAQVRHSLAHNIGEIGELYGKILSNFELEAQDIDDGSPDVIDRATARMNKVRERFLAVTARTALLQQRMNFAKLEPGLAGPWPEEEYKKLLDVSMRMVSMLGLLAGATRRIEPSWCRKLVEVSDLMHPTFIADSLSLFALLNQSLYHGSPLPASMSIMERLAYHHAHSAALRNKPPPSRNTSEQNMETRAQESLVSSITDIFTWDQCHNEQFAIFGSASVALVHVAYGLDDLYRIIADLVGEREMEGFDRALERWAALDARV